MGEWIRLNAADGFSLSAWLARPQGAPKGGIVVLQEIFGANAHIRSVADRFAAEGYLAIAPGLFDRAQEGVDLGYSPADVAEGGRIRASIPLEATLADVQAAIDAAAEGGKVGVVGFCWGGSLAWFASTRLQGASACVGYYGGMIAKALDNPPRVPIILHFGRKDAHIPMSDVAAIRAAYPQLAVFDYDADHGFNCDARGSYDKPSADLAWARTLEFLADKLG